MSSGTSLKEFWEELGRREKAIHAAYKQARIKLNGNSPLARALSEAKELANGVKSNEPYTDQAVLKTAQAAHVIYTMAESIETCQTAGLDITRQLAQMATGSIDFGTPGTTKTKDIYLKDFEYELFIASTLVKKGLHPNFLADANDPIGEMEVNGLILECKHPNTVGRLMQNITKFGNKLLEADRYGLFAAGIEDAYGLGDISVFRNKQEYREWLELKFNAMEADGLKRALQVSRQERILGLIHTQTNWWIIEGQTGLERRGNAMLCDDKKGFKSHEEEVTSVARAFNPSPPRYSTLSPRGD